MQEPRTFRGSEIAPALVEAFDNIPSGMEIVEVKAGENMPVTAILAAEFDIDAGPVEFVEYHWDGERWREDGMIVLGSIAAAIATAVATWALLLWSM